ncbi:hypothetical protein RSAG8_13402, partial [Rhizoctonia solani AG-8 WAC10335]
MPASDWYKRQKGKLKRALHPQNTSSISLPNPSQAQPPASPAPQAVDNPTNEGHRDITGPLSSAKTPAAERPTSSFIHPPVGTASTKSLPNPDVGHLPTLASDEATAAAPNPALIDIPNSEPQTKGIAWPGLSNLLGALKSGAGASGPLQSALEGLERCIDIFKRASKARDDYQELGKKLDELLGDLAEFNNSWMGKAMTASVKNLCGGIEAEIKVIEEKQGRQALGKYSAAVEDSEAIFECYRRINGHMERLMLNANLNMWKTLDEEMTDRRLLQLSPTMSGAYNSWASDRTKRRRCAEGTREAELERLKGWVRNPSAEPIYWINGMAGTGKTTIAYTLCDDLDKTDELAASFFCTRLLPECRAIRLIIPAIAYQLAQFSYPFRHALSKVIQSDPMAHTRGLERQFQALITSPLKAVQNTLPPDTVVIIDALDECEDRDNIEKLLELLVASTVNSPIRFLVSSRPEPEIYRRMMKQVGGNPDAKLVLHELDPLEVQRDIESYLRQELKDVPLTIEQWGGLLQRCGVLFIYASTACRFIKCGNEMMSCKEAMEMVLGLSTGTGDIEKELDKLYTAILESAFKGPHITEAIKKRMKKLLDTVICAQEPMTTEALAGLLDLTDAEHARRLLRPLLSVVNVTEDTGMATTLHASFPDFMLSPDRSAGFYCAATQHHITLTLACLQRIKSNPVQFNICGIESSYLPDMEIEAFPERVKHAVSPALFYACCHWIGYLELAGHSAELREPVIDFLSARLLLWMEVLSVKKSLNYHSFPINQLVKWCQGARMPKEIIHLVDDAGLFTSVYRACFPKHTAHIYTSMLPFWPNTSPISKHYAPRTTGMPQLQGNTIAKRHLPGLASWYMGEPTRAVCYSPDGAYIAAAVGNDVYVLDGWTAQIVMGPLEGHRDQVASVAISPNGSYIASGSYDATIRVWDAKDGKMVTGPFKAHHDRVTSVAFSPDSTRILSTGAFDPVRIWSVQSGAQIVSTSSTSEHRCVRTAVFSSDGSSIISGDDNATIGFWDARTGNLISMQPSEHSAQINSISMSSHGSRFASASADGTIYVWDTETRQVILGPLKGNKDTNQAVFSPNDIHIASGTERDGIHLWDARTSGELVASMQRYLDYGSVWIPTGILNAVSFSPDSSRLVSCSAHGDIFIWDIHYAARTHTGLRSDQRGIHSACFSFDGSQIVTGGRDGSVYLWNVHSGELALGPLTGQKGYICSVAVSPSGAYLASASSDKTIRLWGVKGAKGTYKVLDHHTKRADSLRFTANDSQLLYGSRVYSIGVSPFTSEVASGLSSDNSARDEWAAEVLSDGMPCTASSPDGLYIASGSADGTIQMRHSQTGQLVLGPLRAHTGSISQILFSPNGTHMVTCSLDNTMRFWPIPGKTNDKFVGPHSADVGKVTDISPSPISPWKLEQGGWVVNDRKEHLVWVPDDLRPFLLLPENDLLISHRGSFKLDFTGANIGELWTKCYQPV